MLKDGQLQRAVVHCPFTEHQNHFKFRATNMIRHDSFFMLIAVATLMCLATSAPAAPQPSADAVGLFDAMDEGQADVTLIVKNDHEARLLITNKTDQPLNIQLPNAFAGVPVLAQFGGGGGGGNRGGGGGGGGQQSVGGGGGGGMGGGGGGGGFFNIPPDQTTKVNVPVLCLDHGLRDPSSSKPYKIVPASAHVDRPAVIELLQAFGSGQLDHAAAQAAAWHLNNDLSWGELAAKLQGTRRSTSRPPYFTRDQIQAGMAYATQANRLAEINRDEHKRAIEEAREEKDSDSESRSTTEEDANEPESADNESEVEETASTTDENLQS
jgi:hypothetical protein